MTRMGFNFLQGTPVEVDLAQGTKTHRARADQWGIAHRAVGVQGGRMNQFNQPVPGAKPQFDGSHVLDLLDKHDAQTMRVTAPDDLIWAVQQAATEQAQGWGAGDYYMLERAPVTGDLIVEPGRNHRKIYASNGSNAYDAQMIAKAAGLASVSVAWLKAHPEWGGSKDKPLTGALAAALFQEIMKAGSAPASTWLLFERGYRYDGVNITPPRCSMGESPLHPMMIGAWGQGEMPGGFNYKATSYHPSHIVFRDIQIDDATCLSGWNWLLAGVDNGGKAEFGADAEANSVDGWTLYRTKINDVHKAAPSDPLKWHYSVDRCGGGYWANVRGMLFEESLWDHNGWQDGYSPDLDGSKPQPPSMMSHNVYIAHTCLDVTIDRCISARASSIGFQMRPGGRITDCFLLDNNIISNDLGGNYKGAGPVGEYGLHLGNIGTSAGYRNAEGAGALNWGMDIAGRQQAMVDCIICHMSNPADPAEVAAKKNRHWAINMSADRPMIYNNSIHYNWETSNIGIEGLDLAKLDQTTIQNYAGQLLGKPAASIAEYMDHLRGLPHIGTALDDVLTYFRTSFGKHVPARNAPALCTFKPDYRGEGFRWDNRLNWSSGDIAGLHADDRVDLFGNRVKFGRFTKTIAGMTFRDGLLEVTSGKLTVAAHADAARVHIRNSGQYFAPGGHGDYDVRGGRLVLTAPATAGLTISGQAECLLGPDLLIPMGKTLRADGGQACIGWDGDGAPVLTLQGTLDLRSTPILAFGAAQFSPRYAQDYQLQGQSSGFTGIVDSMIWTGTSSRTGWHVRLRDLQGQPVMDEIAISQTATNMRSTWVPAVGAILPAEMPRIAAFRSGLHGLAAPAVTPTVVLAGALHLDLRGVVAGSYPLIDATIRGRFSDVTVANLSPDLDAHLSVTENGVMLILQPGRGQIML